jgi:hypothetical protein
VRISIKAASGTRSFTRECISSAALREKVSARMRAGLTPLFATRCSILATSTPVLPVPGPASTSRGPPECSTAWRCLSLRSWPATNFPRRSLHRAAGFP